MTTAFCVWVLAFFNATACYKEDNEAKVALVNKTSPILREVLAHVHAYSLTHSIHLDFSNRGADYILIGLYEDGKFIMCIKMQLVDDKLHCTCTCIVARDQHEIVAKTRIIRRVEGTEVKDVKQGVEDALNQIFHEWVLFKNSIM
jgi:hypothetical protein